MHDRPSAALACRDTQLLIIRHAALPRERAQLLGVGGCRLTGHRPLGGLDRPGGEGCFDGRSCSRASRILNLSDWPRRSAAAEPVAEPLGEPRSWRMASRERMG